MRLHYSQTNDWDKPSMLSVLLPYEITLFSNCCSVSFLISSVLLPYEITLFSNTVLLIMRRLLVLLPYEITLFSNQDIVNNALR